MEDKGQDDTGILYNIVEKTHGQRFSWMYSYFEINKMKHFKHKTHVIAHILKNPFVIPCLGSG